MDAATHYFERLAQFAAERPPPGGFVLLGSSHLEWFDAPRLLPGRPWVNRGIACDRLGVEEPGCRPRGILHRLDVSAFELRPALVVFENGVNDLGELWRYGVPAFATIVELYERVVAALRTGLPAVPLVIVNILPTRGEYAGLNELVRDLNPHVARIAGMYGCPLLDMHRVLLDGRGELRAELTEDGLHLNEAGYALFAERLAPLLPTKQPPPVS